MKLLPKKTPFFWLYFTAGGLGIILGIFLLPVWKNTSVFWRDWGNIAVNLIMLISIAAYIFFYLIPSFKKEHRESIRMLIVIECVLFAVIALGCVFEQFKVINLSGPCVILGMALWIRGVIYVVKGYLYRHSSGERHYSLIDITFAIALVTVGAVLVVRPFFTELHLTWVGSIAVIVTAVILIIFGITSIPKDR